jgi:hypothetical protein
MMKRFLAVLSAVAILALPGRLLAHEGHAHKVMGTITAIDAARVEVDTKDGKKESYPLTKDTKCMRGKAAAALADVKKGERVVLSVVEKDGQKSVTEILLSESGHSGAHAHQH